MRTCKTLIVLTMVAILPALVIAEEKNSNSVTKQQTIQPTSSTLYDLSSNQQIYVDPRTGQVSKSPGGVTGGTNPTQTAPAVVTNENPLPFDKFNATQDNVLNSHLLIQLSMAVYCDALEEDDFKDELFEKLEPQGIKWHQIQTKMDPVKGTELAIFTVGKATIIVFRGTSTAGTHAPTADWYSDSFDTPMPYSINNKGCFIHSGFWDSADTVYDWVLDKARAAHFDDQEVWVTGHSLGGAMATITSFRLMYEDQIPIRSLQTFGSPKVGDENFVSLFNEKGPNETRLNQVAQRFVVDGDPVTTFSNGEFVSWNPFSKMYVKYEHVGKTHTILPLGVDDYEIVFDSGEDENMNLHPLAWPIFVSGGGPHMLYENGLYHEVIGLSEFNDVRQAIIDHSLVE